MTREPGAKGSLSHRMFVALVVACALVAVAVTAAASLIYQSAFLSDEHEQLASECRTIASLLDLAEDDATVLGELDMGDIRVTLVSPDGTVTYDSGADAVELPNHADRPEVAAALAEGTGSSERSSDTVGYMSLYEAVRLESGEVVRLSVDRAGVVAFLFQDLAMLCGLAVLLVGASWVVSRRLSRRFVRPILEIDPASGDGVAPYEELDPLVSRLNEQHKELVQRMNAIQDAADMRRDFTANVTHELKTPIASIQGAAELIRDGIARPEDVQGFAGRIYKDAHRLSVLVSDILTLSPSRRVGALGRPRGLRGCGARGPPLRRVRRSRAPAGQSAAQVRGHDLALRRLHAHHGQRAPARRAREQPRRERHPLQPPGRARFRVGAPAGRAALPARERHGDRHPA